MSTSPIFMFAPVPLTNEIRPLARFAALVRPQGADNRVLPVPRHHLLAIDKKVVRA